MPTDHQDEHHLRHLHTYQQEFLLHQLCKQVSYKKICKNTLINPIVQNNAFLNNFN